MKDVFGYIGVAMMLASAVPYFLALARKEIKPHAFSWLLWSLINAIVFAAQLEKEAGGGAWPTGVCALINIIIGLYALKFGERQYTKSDWVFLTLALTAIPLWVMTDDPLWSVVLVSAIDILAFLPTIRKSWLRPFEENATTFVFGTSAFLFSILALENYILSNYLYPAVVLMANAFFVTMLLWRRKVLVA